MSSLIDQIKERVDIVDLISGYLKLQKSGVNYKARCPFHNEKTPSFFVSPERQIWHCFGCHAGGDIFSFVRQIEGIEFADALRILAARAGIELHHRSPEYKQFQTARTRLYEICELATKFFEKQLWESKTGREALMYLRERGLTDDSIKSFRLGYAPDSWQALGNFLGRGFSNEEILAAGLVVKKSDNLKLGFYDRFRSRIIFPIFDLNGQVVGFSGRIFPEAALATTGDQNAGAKYINTPQTLIYDKSKILYGLDKAKLDIRQKNKCLVVEGNIDVIMSHQVGVTNTIASSGTALTDSHLKIIKRYTDNLDLCFDADSAGALATERGVDLALARGFNVGIVAIDEPGLKDPADYVKKYGQKWAEFSQKSKPFLEFYFETARKSFDITTALGKKLLTQKLMPFLASLVNKVEQAHWVSEIALALKVKEDVIFQQLSLVKPISFESQEEDNFATTEGEKFDVLEEGVLALIMRKPQLISNIQPEDEEFLSERLREVIRNVNLALEKVDHGSSSEIMARLTSAVEPKLAMSLEFIYLKSQELWMDIEDDKLTAEFRKMLNQMKKKRILAQLEDLEFKIKMAEKDRNKERLAVLTSEFSEISKKLLAFDYDEEEDAKN
jgi:DNA primase